MEYALRLKACADAPCFVRDTETVTLAVMTAVANVATVYGVYNLKLISSVNTEALAVPTARR
jgi:hypothetical protein